MSLYTRLLGIDVGTTPETGPISKHQFMAAIGEWERGFWTQAQVVALFHLSSSEEAEAATLLTQIVYPRDSITLATVPAGHALTNIGTSYDGAGGLALGFALIQTAGITSVQFGVRVTKIGTGTQSWQLWNDTDGGEVAVIDDAGPTGLKYLSVTKDFPTPLGPGMKVARVRAKSTTANDDPIYFSAFLSTRRASSLTALELHEVLLLAEPLDSPLHTESALKARLGV